MPNLVDVGEDGHIKRWPWVELTMTPTPSNPLAAMYTVKSADLVDDLALADIAIPADLVAAALKALDAEPDDDDGLRFVDLADRLRVDLDALAAKSGRVLSSSTRERLARHPGSLRELADDLDALLTESDADKGKAIDLIVLALAYERTRSRRAGRGVPSPQGD